MLAPSAGGMGAASLPVKHDWVMCEDCSQWRRVSKELAQSLKPESVW